MLGKFILSIIIIGAFYYLLIYNIDEHTMLYKQDNTSRIQNLADSTFLQQEFTVQPLDSLLDTYKVLIIQ